jgi:phosphatidylserine/phosphatidylglycerophosphate/cardiolipin synthase-like enzyme
LHTTARWKIHHDKYIIVDKRIVETGSFNYSKSAAEVNSENVIVIDDPATARKYLKHWESRWNAGREWQSEY